MRNIFGSLFLTVFLVSCSNSDSSTFTLVCNVDSNWRGNIAGLKGEESKKESITLNFKNKKLDAYECPIWDDDRISCGRDVNNDLLYLNERLVLDRKSGVVNYFRSSKEGSVSEHKTYTGKCEKVKDNKF